MELRQIDHFLAVVEQGSFTGGARARSIVQSALSTSIRNLERELGAALFERTTRKVTLSEAGRVFLPGARRVLAEAEAASDAVRSVAGLDQGRVTIGILQWLGPIDLPTELAVFHRRHPGIQIGVWNDTASELLTRLRAGDLDLAYVASDQPLPGDLAGHTAYRENLVLITPPAHPLAGREQVRWSELGDLPYVEFSEGSAVTTVVRRVSGQLGLRRRVVGQVSQVDLQLALVRSGLGVSIVQETLARARAGTGELSIATLTEPAAYLEVSLVSRNARPTNPAADALLQHLTPLTFANDMGPTVARSDPLNAY